MYSFNRLLEWMRERTLCAVADNLINKKNQKGNQYKLPKIMYKQQSRYVFLQALFIKQKIVGGAKLKRRDLIASVMKTP